VWRHTGRKNWVSCAVLTDNHAGLRTVPSGRLSHRELRSSLRESHSVLSVPADITIASQGTQPQPLFLAIYSADEHRTIYSFSYATSYFTFYAFFSSFRVILWPMWVANSKRQPCFYPLWSHAQEDTQNWTKNWQTWWETCAVPENIQFCFSCSFFTQLNCTAYLRVYGALIAHLALLLSFAILIIGGNCSLLLPPCASNHQK
jgi:hypothetical protein